MSTAVLFGLYFSLAVTGMGIIFTPALLRLLHVPEELMKMTAVYLRIIFIGAPFTYFYNALSSAAQKRRRFENAAEISDVFLGA